MWLFILFFSFIYILISRIKPPKVIHDIKRLSLLPIQYPKMWTCFKKQQGHFWTEESIDYTQDVEDWEGLHPVLKRIFKKIFAIFNVLDTIVDSNIQEISEHLPQHYLEAQGFYSAQEFMETIHKKTYGDIIETLCPEEREELLLNARESEFIRKKVQVSCNTRGKGISLAEKIIANGCVEGIGFSSLFAPIFWLKGINKLPGVRFANEEIITDEAIHLEGAVQVYEDLISDGEIGRLSQTRVEEIVNEFVETEIECAKEILGDSTPEEKLVLRDLTLENMSLYIKFVADFYLNSLGYKKKYLTKNPFSFMDMTSLITKSNFFEKHVAEYKHIQLKDVNPKDIKTDLSKPF